jgi:hypothetical protein
VDVSWSLVDRILREDGPDPSWVALIDRFPDRFVLGSDSVGDLEGLSAQAARLERLLDSLSPAGRDLVASGDAQRLWFQSAP